MLYVVIGFVLILFGVQSFFRRGQGLAGAQQGRSAIIGSLLGSPAVGVLLILAGLGFLASTSFVLVAADKVGHLKRVYLAADLPPGRIIALPGEKGPQAEILGPGFHFRPLLNVLYDVEERNVVQIPEGYYGQITTLDGAPMPEGMFIAPVIADDKLATMLEAQAYIEQGGFRGPQETVLKPGSYRLNQYLFDVRIDQETMATIIPTGQVGVVKSNVQQPGLNCREEMVRVSQAQHDAEALSVPLVPRGCIGLWKDPLLPGAYYLNRHAYDVTLVDTRVQTWEYKGGYTRRFIDLSLDQQGNLNQVERSVNVPKPDAAVDIAVFVKVEGWDIPQELRAVAQVSPENAPIVAGSVGGVDQIEHRILTPLIRSIVRNVAGSSIRIPVKEGDTIVGYETRPTRVIDFIENRESIEETIEAQIKTEARKAGVEIKEVRLGEPAIPPEILLGRQRQQLADQLGEAYKRETEAQKQRIETEQAKATANEQPRLVESQIAVKVAEQKEAERAALGRAERKYLEEIAQGQSAQANVLGQDRVAMLQALEKVLGSLERQPQLVELMGKLVPNTVVTGSGFEGAAAILGDAIGKSQPTSP
ncbi:SPFH domain-containing protein [Aestuariivirga sp.]|uniref:SPFH domain-containing protein n=1 Tax=Aestuariivirga sp. TaxID=2650926 RepID=UPI003593DEDD